MAGPAHVGTPSGDTDPELIGQLISLGLGREMATMACSATGNQGLSAAAAWASQWFRVVLREADATDQTQGDASQRDAVLSSGPVAAPSRQPSRAGSRAGFTVLGPSTPSCRNAPGAAAGLPANVLSAIAQKLEQQEYLTSIPGFCPTIPTSSSRPAPSAAPAPVVHAGLLGAAELSPRERPISVRRTWKGTVAGRVPPLTPRLSLRNERLATVASETGRRCSTAPPASGRGRKLRTGPKKTPLDIKAGKPMLISNVFNSTLTRAHLMNVVPLTPRTMTPCSARENLRPMSARRSEEPVSRAQLFGVRELRPGSTGATGERRDRPSNCSARPSPVVRSSQVESPDKRGEALATMVLDGERGCASTQRQTFSSLKVTRPRMREGVTPHMPAQLNDLKTEVASLRAELQAFVNTHAPARTPRQDVECLPDTDVSVAGFGKKKAGMYYDGRAMSREIVDNEGVLIA